MLKFTCVAVVQSAAWCLAFTSCFFCFGRVFFWTANQGQSVAFLCYFTNTADNLWREDGSWSPTRLLIFYHVRSDGGSESRCTDHLDLWSKLPEDKSLKEFEWFTEASWKPISRYFHVSILDSVLILKHYCTFQNYFSRVNVFFLFVCFFWGGCQNIAHTKYLVMWFLVIITCWITFFLH